MKNSILPIFGQTIRHLRIQKGLSQEALADLCGLHRTYISDVELGKRNLSLENIEKISISLDISISSIFLHMENLYAKL